MDNVLSIEKMKIYKQLNQLIDQITLFGLESDLAIQNKVDVLKVSLVKMYLIYLELEPRGDEKIYPDVPDMDYKGIRQNVQSNFPDFGWYSIVLDSNKLELEAEIATGDEIDDLSDIILDLLKVKWRFKNTSKQDALWHFKFLMKAHSESHLLSLLKRLTE